MRSVASDERARRFGPLVAMLFLSSLTLLLPTSLTRPDTAPPAIPEVAPVPPSDPQADPPISNFRALGAARSGLDPGEGSGGGGAGGGAAAAPAIGRPVAQANADGVGRTPASQYECVAGRQTEDELSPTCVPYFAGSNGGVTYQGVTGREVRVVLYYDDITSINTSQGSSTPPTNTIVDVDDPPRPREHPVISVTRSWQKYFYRRYAAYGRKVHLFVHFGSRDAQGSHSPGSVAGDAALAYRTLKPFAVLNFSGGGLAGYYNEYMWQHGVLVFGAPAGHNNQFFSRYPGLHWGYNPTLEYSAAQYTEAVCGILKGRPADGMGVGTVGDAQNGTSRKYGLLTTSDRDWPGVRAQTVLSKRLIAERCGIKPVVEMSYPRNGRSVDNDLNQQNYADNIARQFQQSGVTTILWPAGHETKISRAMARMRYYPEIIAGDDDLQASRVTGRFQDQVAWNQAWVVTSQAYQPAPEERICTQAFRSVDQQAPASDVHDFACEAYTDLRQLHTGIQAAGPRLTPETLNQGMHAIPRIESTNRQLPTCYYLANDYTCVKDSAIMHWDATAGSASDAKPGCWRMVGDGRRFLPGKFPTQVNLTQLKRTRDVCNNYVAPATLSP